jgi:hypothetical protein
MKRLLLICLISFLGNSFINAQTTEDFESETVGSTIFTDNGQNFTITNGVGENSYDVETFGSGGWNGTGSDNQFIDNSGGTPANGDGSSFTISTTDATDIYLKSFYLFVSNRSLTASGQPTTITFIGRAGGAVQFTVVKTSGIVDGSGFTPNNGFTFIDFSTEGGSDNSNTLIDEIIISSTLNADYLALDAMRWQTAPTCTDPDVPTPTASVNNVCPSTNVTLNWTGDALNDATNWHIYTTSCGTGQLATTTGNTLVVNPTVTTTYYIRGEDGAGCVDESSGACGSITVTVDKTASTLTSAAASANNVCPSTSVDLTANGLTLGSGAAFNWYTGTGGTGSNLGNSNPLNVSPATTTTYYAYVAGTCNTLEQSITVTVDQTTSTLTSATASTNNVCPSTSVDLTANGLTLGSGAAFNWYTGTGGTGSNLGNSNPLSVSPATTTTYYAYVSGTCNTLEQSITVTVDSIVDQTVTASSATICSGDSTTIDLGSSETGVSYTLRDDADDSVITGPIAGTGGPISFNTGNITNTTTYNVYAGAPVSSTALDFGGNGSGDFVNMGTGINSVFTGTNQITVEAWVKRTSMGSLQTIASNYASNMQFLLRIDNDRIAFWVSNGSFTSANGGTVLPVDTWMHISGTWDGATIKVYYNGVLDGSTPYTGNMPAVSNTFRIGGGFGSEYFPGSIADVSVWNIAKTQAEIATDQTACITGVETGIIALYKMGDGAGSSSLTDLTGNGYDGTLNAMDVNTVWNSSFTPTCTTCDFEMTQTATVTVNTIVDQTVTASSATICSGNSTTIDLGSSEIGVRYFLRDDADDSVIAGPIAGTGGSISFNTGNITGTTTYNVYAETLDGALDFDGSNDYINTNIDISHTVYPEFTFEAWVYPTRVGYGSRQAIFSHDNCCYDRGVIIESGTSSWGVAVGGALWIAGSVDVNQWQHIAVVYDEVSKTAKFYKNGVESVYSGGPTNFSASSNPMWLGRNPGYNEPFQGAMDDVRIWNTVRNQSNISTEMNSCLVGNEAGLSTYYKLDDGNGSSVAIDATGNGNNGSLNNMDASTDWILGTQSCSSCDLEMTQTATVTVTPLDDASFNYSAASYAVDDSDPTPTITGLTGGTFSSMPAGLSLNASNGLIDVSASTLNTFTVTYTTAGACPNTSSVSVQITASLGVQENVLEANIGLYPNPNNGNFILSYLGQEKLTQLTIFDVTGKRIQTISLNTFNQSKEISLTDLAQGMYLVNIESENSSTTKRMVIK